LLIIVALSLFVLCLGCTPRATIGVITSNTGVVLDTDCAPCITPCDIYGNASIVVNNDYDLAIPEDFYVVFETTLNPLKFDGYTWSTPTQFVSLLDTKNNEIGKAACLLPGTYYHVLTPFCILPEDLQSIYNVIVRNDIKSYSGPDMLTCKEFAFFSPNTGWRITLHFNGEIYSILYDTYAVAGPQYASHIYQNLAIFHKMLINFCMSTDEYQSFPEDNCWYY